MLAALRTTLQALSVLLLVLAVVLAGQSGFALDTATGPAILLLAAGAILYASRLAKPGTLPAPTDSGDPSSAGDVDLHRASFLHDDGHTTPSE
jgi:hypothetical protein